MTANVPPVPMCDIGAQNKALEHEILEALARVVRSGQVILGPEVAALEREVAAYCGAAHGVGCSSGSDALLLALAALDVGPGDEVILPPFTFFATAGAVARLGARPVFADIDPVTYNLDPPQVENKITPRTRAILPVHLYGQCADMDGLNAVAARHRLAVVEDAAQAIGAEYDGRRAGSLGTVGCFSFYPSKNLGTVGDAGLVTTHDAALAQRMACLRVHGMEPRYYHKYIGWNARIDPVQAAVLRVKLPHLDGWIARRQQAAARYDALIEDRHLGGFLNRPVRRPRRRHVFNQYVVRVADGLRDSLVHYLKENGVSCDIYYPVPLHRQECFTYLGCREGAFPASEEACRSVLALPIFPEITEGQQARVVDACAAFLRQRARKAA